MNGSGSETKRKPKLRFWIQRSIIAFFITIAIQLVFIYVKYGEFSGHFSITFFMEFSFTFLYFLCLFWLYPKISAFVHSQVLNRFKPVYLNIFEGFSVMFSTLILSVITKMLPLWLMAIVINARNEDLNIVFDMEAVRRSLIVHAALGLFLYYFVERERIRKQIQAEHLRYAELQREEFKGQLENLKNQVNPQFLFHSLETLDSLIGKDGEEAAEFVKRLSYVYRSFLKTGEQVIPLARELEITEAYIYILTARFGDALRFEIKISPEYRSLQLPPGSLQVLIDSAIFHQKFTDEKTLDIHIGTEDEKLRLSFSPSFSGKGASLETGLKNIEERYEYLSDEKLELVQTSHGYSVFLPLLRIQEENAV